MKTKLKNIQVFLGLLTAAMILFQPALAFADTLDSPSQKSLRETAYNRIFMLVDSEKSTSTFQARHLTSISGTRG